MLLLYFRYSLWGWGFPTLLSGITIVMQYLPEPLTSGLVIPEIGKMKCFLGDRAPMFYYFHIVTGPCLLFNLLGFVCTSYNLCCGIWSSRQGDSSMALAQQRFRMITLVKMFFAMGISWLAEFISWLLAYHFGREGWVIKWSFGFDIINASQVRGIFVYYNRLNHFELRIFTTMVAQGCR